MGGNGCGVIGLVLMDGAMFSKSSIPFFVGGQGSVPSLLLGLGTNYGRVNGNLLQKGLCQHRCSQCP